MRSAGSAMCEVELVGEMLGQRFGLGQRGGEIMLVAVE